ncbi:endonuclease/exonuclease/phosphatase family protein [Denitrobaculum tricleocarpae]|uniref:Endonuclease n=1 Tax=Denitrobaculum tricleocarpae TaxID=2591009 RepID=A0A545TTK8_9PROT|nr:endonuclease/exonuclease/phosphatase family protein [Denitrobaculum tricleocarpae]TQV80552.1 endonuclease [Denitrobaculum tricleocarpae]
MLLPYVALIVAVLVIIVTLLPLIKRGRWWIRVCDYPRLQIGFFGLLALAGLLLLEVPEGMKWPVAAALLAALVYQFWLVIPFSPIFRSQVVRAEEGDDPYRVSILVANVLTPNRRADDLLKIICDADADIVLVLEPDDWWQQKLDAIEEDYPHTIKRPLDNTYGMLLYSKHPLIEPECRFLVAEGIPSFRAFLELPSGDRVRFHGLHPNPPQVGLDTVGRDAELVIVAREIQGHSEPVIVAGDMNDVAWSHTTRLFLRLSSMMDPRIGRGLYSTYNAKIPFFRWPLDHVFHSSSFRLLSLKRLPYFGSDHFPLYCELLLDHSVHEEHEPPEPALEDHHEARRMIEEGKNDESLKLN